MLASVLYRDPGVAEVKRYLERGARQSQTQRPLHSDTALLRIGSTVRSKLDGRLHVTRPGLKLIPETFQPCTEQSLWGGDGGASAKELYRPFREVRRLDPQQMQQ